MLDIAEIQDDGNSKRAKELILNYIYFHNNDCSRLEEAKVINDLEFATFIFMIC